MKWFDAKIIGCSTGSNGELVAEVHTRIRWWHPSFWRELRSAIEATPAWLAWPLVMWFMATRGWRINRGHE